MLLQHRTQPSYSRPRLRHQLANKQRVSSVQTYLIIDGFSLVNIILFIVMPHLDDVHLGFKLASNSFVNNSHLRVIMQRSMVVMFAYFTGLSFFVTLKCFIQYGSSSVCFQ